MIPRWLTVVGLGEEAGGGIGRLGLDAIRAAELLVGGERHLAMIPLEASDAERLVWGQPFRDTIDVILSHRGRPVAILASGDPMEWGVGATLTRYLAADEMTVLPHPGAFSLAAARLAWPLHEIKRMTLHGRSLDRLARLLQSGVRLIALSRDGDTPLAVARWLEARGWGQSEIIVLERLGGPAERLTKALASQFPDERFADLNTLAITLRPSTTTRALSRLAGLPDDCFEHDGQLTKRDVRAATLAKLSPCAGETLWDVGAGCGSIAIEWLRAEEGMSAVAIERSPDRCGLIARNAQMLGVPELEIIEGEAPSALAGLPSPDAVFIGGGLSEETLDQCWKALRPGGRLVANAVSLEAETILVAAFGRLEGEMTRISATHLSPLGDHHVWRAAMPVCQFSARKPL